MSALINRPVLIAAAGTGGHVFPALVVANELVARNISVVWLGTHRGIEARVVPSAGFDMEWMEVEGLRGKGKLALLQAPWKLIRAVCFSIKILRKHKPIAVLGMGGFVTGPIGLAALLLRKPLVLHEQNAIPGMTNKLLGRFATRVLQAFPAAFPLSFSAITVGNPLRKPMAKSCDAELEREDVRVLVIGGSLGARFFNETMPKVAARLCRKYTIRHQTGKGNAALVEGLYSQGNAQCGVQVLEFIDDMSESYQWADLVICRAGAMTVSELAASAKPSILVPFPYAVDDHQTKNAQLLVDAGAAQLFQEAELGVENLVEAIHGLSDKTLLGKMSVNAKNIAVLDAGTKVTNLLLEVAV